LAEFRNCTDNCYQHRIRCMTLLTAQRRGTCSKSTLQFKMMMSSNHSTQPVGCGYAMRSLCVWKCIQREETFASDLSSPEYGKMKKEYDSKRGALGSFLLRYFFGHTVHPLVRVALSYVVFHNRLYVIPGASFIWPTSCQPPYRTEICSLSEEPTTHAAWVTWWRNRPHTRSVADDVCFRHSRCVN
jgi:hypothetical protein